jgi:hypothetical protein
MDDYGGLIRDFGGYIPFFVVAFIFIGILVGIYFLVRHLIEARQSSLVKKAELTLSKNYEQLAEKAVGAQESLARETQRIAKELAEMRESVANMERLLREVD